MRESKFRTALCSIVALFIVASLLSALSPALFAEEAARQYPVSGTVYKKSKGVSAKHVSEKNGQDAAPQPTYFICIQRDPRTDRYADSWLVYRQCWDTTKEVYEMVDVCDWFMVRDPQIKDQDTRPDERIFRKQRKQDAAAIKRFHECD